MKESATSHTSDEGMAAPDVGTSEDGGIRILIADADAIRGR
jgi:hypothetical protein